MEGDALPRLSSKKIPGIGPHRWGFVAKLTLVIP
jgi:hypothetical protein